MNNQIISPVGIDFGAKYTGVYYSQFEHDENPLVSENKFGQLIIIPDDKLTLSQVSRRQKRHQRRTFKRRKMAKRLIIVMLKERYSLDILNLDRKFRDEILGYMNRRGYTYLSADDIKEQMIDSAPVEWYAKIFDPLITGDELLTIQLEKLSQQPERIKELSSHHNNNIPYRDFNKHFANSLSEFSDFKKLIKESYSEFKKAIDVMSKSITEGHKPRAEYLNDIHKDINHNHSLIKLLAEHNIEPLHFFHFIGHINNLKLKVLRKYFNDTQMKSADYWDDQRLFKCISRDIRSWHPSLEDKPRYHRLIAAIKKYKSSMDFMLNISPIDTIPFYEDQNNRRPPKCQSLLLDASQLDRYYPNWQTITDSISEYIFDDNLSKISKSQLLQRILDQRDDISKFHIRKLVKNSGNDTLTDCRENLIDILGSKNANILLDIAKQYYLECALAAKGNWHIDVPNRILSRCDLNPPRKTKLLNYHLSTLLSCPFTEDDLSEFENFYNSEGYERNKTLKKRAEEANKAQKKHGITLKKAILFDPELITLQTEINKAGAFLELYIRNTFNVDIAEGSYQNIFIFIQLHNLMDPTQRSGFSNTCRSCTVENAWRGQITEGKANGKRLPADSGRPFNGLIARLADVVALEIASQKYEQIKKAVTDNSTVLVPVLIEQNSFEFTAELQELKKDRLKSQFEEQGNLDSLLWIEKDNRIKQDSKNICPYTGKYITSHGEIDHIIPQSITKNFKGVVFNSEPNLIYCSNEGNNKKSNSSYTLDNLHSTYLREQFNTTDVSKIKALIISNLDNILSEKAITNFYQLSDNDRSIIRHALFVPETRNKVLDFLNKQTTARINGSQRWLAKRISYFLRKKLKQGGIKNIVDIQFFNLDVSDIVLFRSRLSEKYSTYKKTSPQPAFSHVIDATMAFVSFFAQTATEYCDSEIDVENPDSLKILLPDDIKIITKVRKEKYNKKQPQSQPLFKDGLYGMRFLPILITPQQDLRIGFNLANSIVIKQNPKKFFESIKQFLRFNSLPVNQAYKFWIDKAHNENTSLYFSFDKHRAIHHLHTVAHSKPNDPLDIIQADILDKLLYLVQKKDIRKHLKECGKKKFPIVQDQSFTINFKISGEFKTAGSIILPAINQWTKLCHSLCLSPKTYPSISDHEIDDLFSSIKNFFEKHPPKTILNHKKVRKVYSLPLLPIPSGAMYRIQSKSLLQQPVWRLQAIDGDAYAGFLFSKSHSTLNNAVLATFLKESKNIHLVEGRFEISNSPIIPKDQWIEIPVPEPIKNLILKLWLKPGQKTRRYVRLCMTFHKLRELILNSLALEEQIDNGLLLPSEIKIKEKGIFRDNFHSLIGAPRTKISFSRIGSTVEFEFENECCPSELVKQYIQIWEQIYLSHETLVHS
ncbi:MAG: type II-B CRISPR-associated RNA-guided endonuclease Cas9/Csx12 [Candidatus Auribacterota bacterium]